MVHLDVTVEHSCRSAHKKSVNVQAKGFTSSKSIIYNLYDRAPSSSCFISIVHSLLVKMKKCY